jgi:hypothetical protein
MIKFFNRNKDKPNEILDFSSFSSSTLKKQKFVYILEKTQIKFEANIMVILKNESIKVKKRYNEKIKLIKTIFLGKKVV